jgi:hypothetical protein
MCCDVESTIDGISIWLSANANGSDGFLCQERLVHATSNSLFSRFTIVPVVDALAESDSCFVCFWNAIEVQAAHALQIFWQSDLVITDMN